MLQGSAWGRGIESLTGGKFAEKEFPRLRRQNRQMFLPMETMSRTFCECVQLTLAAGLFAACAANVALVWAFLF